FKLALLSNIPVDVCKYLSANIEWFSYFDHLVFSCDLHEVKPHPKIYQNCLEKLQLRPEEVLFFDDMPQNVEVAKKCGIHALVFTTAESTLVRVKEKFDLPMPDFFDDSVASSAAK